MIQSVTVPGEAFLPIEKEKISIKPDLEAIKIQRNRKIVDKYYGEDVKNEIIAGQTNYWDISYNYKITPK